MPSDRKPYIRVARSILHEPWPDDVKLACVLLQCHMANRWATDRLTAAEACETVLSRGDMLSITGRKRSDSALVVLNKLASKISIDVRYEDGYATIKWPKLADYQGWDARERAENGGELGPTRGQSAPAPSPAPKTSHTHTESEGVSPEAGRAFVPPEWVSIPLVLQAISGEPGEPAEKTAWLHRDLALMISEIEADPKLRRPGNKANALAALGVRYYRRRNDGPRKAGAKPKGAAPLRSGYESATERATREADEWLRSQKESAQ